MPTRAVSRLLCVAIALIVSMALLAACGGGGDKPAATERAGHRRRQGR